MMKRDVDGREKPGHDENLIPSLRAKRSNPALREESWIASSLRFSQ
jgi:hypothetical protein